MPTPPADVIVAIATAPGRGGIGIVRLSGTDLSPWIRGLLGRAALPPRQAVHANFLGGEGAALDDGIALYFAAPRSYTGEDVLELHGHGGPAVLAGIVQRCVELGARLAEPGEFTRRAFLNDKLDLAQAEAVADLIDAGTAAAARAAMRSLSGDFSREVRALVDALVHLRMFTEATLDFPDEDVEFIEAARARDQVAELAARVAGILQRARQGQLLREGLQVVLIGQPNVGKSSLLNRLAKDDVAIVTAIAGTTRDAVRQQIEIAGIALHVIDTAGVRDLAAADEVERLGIARTWAAAAAADCALVVVDDAAGISAGDEAILARLPADMRRLVVHNKIDLSAWPARVESHGAVTHVHLSARTGAGIALLESALLQVAGWQATVPDQFLARERHVLALKAASTHIAAAGELLASLAPALELFAEELKLAQSALSAITGEFTPDDLLGEIFSRFCIGK
ncbi:MAG: tRNA uridine-5-carboxymethylaminomethyl(34) synthesis GTPase MnmE [Betaproteobacteria bacterium]|nr:tRNA uridine-5-carboxymethylaminomethyl(34) synthesis GTPase MnmE [Betaproteobacteria bacterium]